MVIVFGIFFVVMIFKLFSMIGEQEDRIDELWDRLDKLEQDAVKITFDNDRVI
jgi:predicted AAA+ superfamily ATPase